MPSPEKSRGAATLAQSSDSSIWPNVPSPASSNQRGSQSCTADSSMICLLRSSERSSSSPNWSGWTNGRRAASEDDNTRRTVPSARTRGHETTFEMGAAQQRRVRRVADVEHRHDGVLGGGETLGGDEQAVAVEDHLVRAAGELGRRDDLGVGDRHDAQAVLTGHVHVAAIRLDDVTLVDADLLGVGAGVRRRPGRRQSSPRAPRRVMRRRRPSPRPRAMSTAYAGP